MAGESGGSGEDDDYRVAELLAAERRRLTLEVLQTFEEPITLADLAEEVAIRERDAAITDVSGETVADVYHSLYHTHIPRLAEAEIVAYDQDADIVHTADPGALERLVSADVEWE